MSSVSCLFLLITLSQQCIGQTTITLLNTLQITYINRGAYTDFTVSSALGLNDVQTSNCWIGIGFNTQQKMSDTDVVICLNTVTNKTFLHQYNSAYGSDLMDPNNQQLGLTNQSISTTNNVLTCSFSRDNSNSNSKYFNLNTQTPYLIVAYGTPDTNGG